MPRSEDPYTQAFITRYDQATASEYGSAAMSLAERKAITKLYEEVLNQLQTENLLTNDKATNRAIIRERITEHLVAHGWPADPKSITATDLAETAIDHACVVAENLLASRGKEKSHETVWSYTTKDQFDRFVASRLLKSGRIRQGGDLFAEWYSPQNREPGYENERVGYPVGVDSTKIYGVGKAHRYWPAQLMRNLESIRLGRMSSQELTNLQLDSVDSSTFLDTFSIPWKEYESVLQTAKSVDGIAVGVAIQTMETLQERGLNNTQIAEIIINSYSPRGMMTEHGEIPEVSRLWKQLLQTVLAHPRLTLLYSELLVRVQGRFAEVGKKFA